MIKKLLKKHMEHEYLQYLLILIFLFHSKHMSILKLFRIL